MLIHCTHITEVTHLSWLVYRPPRNKALSRHQTNFCKDKFSKRNLFNHKTYSARSNINNVHLNLYRKVVQKNYNFATRGYMTIMGKYEPLTRLIMAINKATNPVNPSTVSSIGRTWILFPYLTSGHAWTLEIKHNKCKK